MSEPTSDDIKTKVIEALRTVHDPEIPVNIYDLGLIYEIEVDEVRAVAIRMTLTSPACPVAGILPGQVESKAKGVEGVSAAKVELVWEPPWSPACMSEAAKLQLGFEDDPPTGFVSQDSFTKKPH